MTSLTTVSVDEFLDQVASRTPTPGGGGVAATAGALACAMARMVAAYSVGKKTEAPVRAAVEATMEKLNNLDQLLRTLVDEDAKAYSRMTRAEKSWRDGQGSQDDYQQAVLDAIGVPMQMAALVSTALVELDEFKASASRFLVSDLGVAAVLAATTARAAWYSVVVNANELGDVALREKILNDIDTMVSRSDQLRLSIECFVRERLTTASKT